MRMEEEEDLASLGEAKKAQNSRGREEEATRAKK